MCRHWPCGLTCWRKLENPKYKHKKSVTHMDSYLPHNPDLTSELHTDWNYAYNLDHNHGYLASSGQSLDYFLTEGVAQQVVPRHQTPHSHHRENPVRCARHSVLGLCKTTQTITPLPSEYHITTSNNNSV